MNQSYSADQILDFIVEFKTDHNGIAPTRREIQAALSISSTSVVDYWLKRLAAEGLIVFPFGRGAMRAISVPGYEFKETDDSKEPA